MCFNPDEVQMLFEHNDTEVLKRDTMGLPSFSPLFQSFSEFLECAMCNFLRKLGIWRIFWLGFQGHDWISLLVEEGMMIVSCFQQNTGILKNPPQFKVLSSAQQSQVLQVPFFVAAHQTHLHCVN